MLHSLKKLYDCSHYFDGLFPVEQAFETQRRRSKRTNISSQPIMSWRSCQESYLGDCTVRSHSQLTAQVSLVGSLSPGLPGSHAILAAVSAREQSYFGRGEYAGHREFINTRKPFMTFPNRTGLELGKPRLQHVETPTEDDDNGDTADVSVT